MDRYKQNLRIEGDKVISYTTHVATIDRVDRKLYVHGWWSVTTSKHINYVADYYGLTKEERERDPEPKDNTLRTVANVAKLGDLFGRDIKEKNAWKTRMLKAGLENQGLIIPDNWDELDEETKQDRLDAAIEVIK